jgi:DUF1680 family protein
VNGKEVEPDLKENVLYIPINDKTTAISLELNMNVHVVRANANVSADIMKVAVQRGPIVYCLEGVDNEEPLSRYVLGQKPSFDYNYQSKLLNGVGVVTTDDAYRIADDSDDSLYTFDRPKGVEKAHLEFIPYYAWANRDKKQMTVWLHQSEI